jgi:hypothetical protein
MALVRELLAKAVRRTADFDPGLQVRPACILWPDGERQWEAAIPALQKDIPELLVLGAYDPKSRTGPAIWLRCAIERQTDDVSMPGDRTPILYLPGFTRYDLRPVESCPEPLVPLAELQYRGTIWSQLNGKDWTITAFLRSGEGGLGLDVAQDARHGEPHSWPSTASSTRRSPSWSASAWTGLRSTLCSLAATRCATFFAG